MAQLGVQYPSLEGLGGIFEGMGTSQRFNIAKQNEALHQQQALQDLFQNEQMNPLRVRQAQLGNQTTEAQLPGVQADSWNKTRNQQVREGIPLDVEQRAQLSKMAAQMSDDEWKQEEAAIQKALVHPSAAVRAQAQQMLPMLKEFQMERMKATDRQEREAALENLKAQHAQELARINNEAGRFKGKGGSGVKNIDDAILAGKLTYEKAAVYFENAAAEAQAAGDEDKAMLLLERARMYEQKAKEKAAAGVGAVDRPDLKGLGIPTTKPQVSPPVGAAPKAAGAAEDWIARSMKANPGMTREQIIAEGKRRGKL